MLNKPTELLFKSLLKSNLLENYLAENEGSFSEQTLSGYLRTLLINKNLNKSDVIRKSELSYDYAIQIFSGLRKSPSRDKLICLCIGMSLTIEETDRVLRFTGFSPLYPKKLRDSIIMFGIKENQSICVINTALFENSENTIN